LNQRFFFKSRLVALPVKWILAGFPSVSPAANFWQCLETSEHPPEAFFAAQTLFEVKIAVLVPVALRLIEAPEFLVAKKGANLTLIQLDPVALESLSQGRTVRHAAGDGFEPGCAHRWAARLPNAAWSLKRALCSQQRLQVGLAVAGTALAPEIVGFGGGGWVRRRLGGVGGSVGPVSNDSSSTKFARIQLSIRLAEGFWMPNTAQCYLR